MNLIPHHRKSQAIIERTVKYIRYCEVLKISKLLVNYIYNIIVKIFPRFLIIV